MATIDAHIHFAGDDTDSRGFLERLDLKLLNICVAHDAHGQWRSQADRYQRLAQTHPDRYAWCTSFDLPRFDDSRYVETAIQGLEADFAQGAVACKVWKNFGMEVQKPDGSHLLIDDALLEPILAYVASQNKTLLMHIAEPLECWQPLREGTPHYGYYSANPQWHMAGRTDMPSHQALMDARDAVVARHPNLRVIGAHLGSLEYDVDELSTRFERYPNFAVDISARLLDFALQETEKIRRFCLDYQDRILLGTDQVISKPFSTMTPDERERRLKGSYERYQEHFRFFESDAPMTVQNREVRGLGLPADVLEKIYHANAERWYPGI